MSSTSGAEAVVSEASCRDIDRRLSDLQLLEVIEGSAQTGSVHNAGENYSKDGKRVQLCYHS